MKRLKQIEDDDDDSNPFKLLPLDVFTHWVNWAVVGCGFVHIVRCRLVCRLFAQKLCRCVYELPLGPAFMRLVDDKALLGCFPFLRVLKLPPLSRVTNAAVKKLTQLRELRLSFNEEVTDDALAPLSKLHTLVLTENQVITEKGVKAVAGSLTCLNVSHNKRIGNAALLACRRLRVLDVSHCPRVTDKLRMPHVTDLTLTGGSKRLKQPLAAFPNLERLTLLGNPSVNLLDLVSAKKLRYLDIRGSPVITDYTLLQIPSLQCVVVTPNQASVSREYRRKVKVVTRR